MRMKNQRTAAHLAALLTVMIWGTTFISTKILLEDFKPVEILFFRFLLGLFALTAACPKRLKGTDRGQELTFMGAGLCGICLYYLLENIALTYTLASNVGVIISIAPFFTAVLNRLAVRDLEKREPLGPGFLAGFMVAMAGICLISFEGMRVEINPAGDLLAVLAAFIWACYSLLTKKISTFGYPTILTTRRVFGYGLLFMVPALFLFGFEPGLGRLLDPACLLNLLFLGLGACALCFVTWNYAVKTLGALGTSAYIYLVPVVTVAASMLVLRERLTPLSGLGAALTLAGLFVSEGRKWPGKRQAADKNI